MKGSEVKVKTKITVVGLGPGSEDYLTLASLKIMQKAEKLILRTKHHGVAPYLEEQNISFESMDDLYEEAEDFDELAERLVHHLIGQTLEGQDLVYGVPGDGILGDTTVEYLIREGEKAGLSIEIIPGVGQFNHAASLVKKGVTADLRVTSAEEWSSLRPDPRVGLMVMEIDSALKAGQLKLKLLEHYPAEHPVTVICLEREKNEWLYPIPLYQLDQMQHYDHTTCLFVPRVDFEKLENFDFYHLVEIMDRLRGFGGCPWDREQTHRSLKQYLIEEAYEVLEAIDEEDADKLIGELGDVLLQVVFHARIGQEKGQFDIGNVTTGICRKMIDRHTHIFGDAKVNCADEVINNWEAIKKKEKGLESQTQVLKDIPSNLPALMRSFKVQQKAALVGFDWERVEDALLKVDEELQELREEYKKNDQDGIAGELGDLIFAVVNVARFLKVQPELALTSTTEKFIKRFEYIEETAKAQGLKLEEMSLAEMDHLWNEAKKA